MRREVVELIALTATTFAAGYCTWIYFHDPIVLFYVCLFTPLVVFKVLRWPRVHWLLLESLENLRRQLGGCPLERALKKAEPIRVLEGQKPIHSFFNSSRLIDESERLRDDIDEQLTPKIMAYSVALLCLWAMGWGSEHDETLIVLVLKFVAAFSVFAVPLAWDFAKWERQRRINLECIRAAREG